MMGGKRMGARIGGNGYCRLAAACLAAAAWGGCARAPKPAGESKAPETRVDAVVETIHGVEIADPYRWLEDQQSPETRAWIDAQNRHTQALLGNYPGRAAIAQRVSELLRIDTIGMPWATEPTPGGPKRYFFSKRKADQDQPVICMREGAGGQDIPLIDPNAMEDKTASVQLLDATPDGALIAYGIRRGGEDEEEIKLFDVEKREEAPGALPKARYFGISLKPDRKGYFYSVHSDAGSRIYEYSGEEAKTTDALLFGEGFGPEKIISSSLSENGKHLLFTVFYGAGAQRSDLYYRPAQGGAVRPIVDDLDARFNGAFAGDRLFVLTNWNAPNGRIFEIDPEVPERPAWREVVPETDAVIQDFALAGGKIFVRYSLNVRSLVRVYEPEGRHVRDITFPSIGTISSVSGRWDIPEVFLSYTSFHIPQRIYSCDASDWGVKTWAEVRAPIDPEIFEIEQAWCASKDGAKLPMFIVSKKGLARDGKAPALLTGYGGFNISLTPAYSSRAALWVERGGVYAVANLRGGGEFGEKWHEAGMRERKQNVFDDFYAAAEHLIREKYTSSDRLAISGGSNGGLLVGAAMTQRPELFRAVVCSYPLLDMVRYHQFMVAKFWVPEYGSSEDEAQFKTLHAYSPYHHVKAGEKYPAALFITGDGDTRVAPLHARKMAALMQASAAPGSRPILLRYETQAGHSGGRPVSKTIEDLADELSFLFWQLGAEPPSKPAGESKNR